MPTWKKRSEIVSDVLAKIGLVTGTSVQTYTEPQIKAAVQDAFDFVFRKRFWEHLTTWKTYTLDGTTGVLTTDLTNIVRSHEDIRAAFINDTDQKIVRPVDREHLRVTGSSPLYMTPFQFGDANYLTRVMQFWPITATGSVDIRVRTKPAEFGDDDQVPLPRDMIGWVTAWLVLEADGLNPANAAKCQSMFDLTYQDYVQNMGEDAIGHGRNRAYEPLTIR